MKDVLWEVKRTAVACTLGMMLQYDGGARRGTLLAIKADGEECFFLGQMRSGRPGTLVLGSLGKF